MNHTYHAEPTLTTHTRQDLCYVTFSPTWRHLNLNLILILNLNPGHCAPPRPSAAAALSL